MSEITINKFEHDYKHLIKCIINAHDIKSNRTGVNTYYLFNPSLTIDLEKGFPILTSKKIFFEKAYHEYKWMIQGLTTTTYLKKHDIHWWDEYANEKGELGKTYGYQLRNWNGEIDQLDYIHREIRANSRRAHMTLWNPSDLKDVVLPPCYTGFTFSRFGDTLNMSMQLRSSDVFLGLPYDICVAALMLRDIAKFNELRIGSLGIQITDAHIYQNHLKQLTQYLNTPIKSLPIIYTSDEDKVDRLFDYEHGPLIKAKLNN